MSRLVRSGLLVAALLAATGALAAEPKVTAGFDALEIRPDGMTDYEITIAGTDLPDLRTAPRPDFSAFDVLGGPSRSSSTQVSIVGGKMESTRSLTFTWRVVPRGGREGELSVPAFVHETGSLRLRVPAASVRSTMQAAEPRSRGRYGGSTPWDPFDSRRRQQQPEPSQDAHLEVVADVSDEEVWLGQEVVVTHLVEFGSELVVRSFDPEPAEFPGFEKEEREVNHRGRSVAGRDWQEVPLAQWRLVPLTAGTKELPARGYTLTVQRRSRDFFDGFFGGGEQRVRRATRPVSLRVRPLPFGAPESFSGAVGTFQLESELGTSELAEGDGTTLRVVVKGSGNFGRVKAPALELPEGLRSFEAEVREDTRKGRDGLTTGAKIFEFPLLVETSGRLTIPAVRWSYFDPKAGRYVTRETRPQLLNAAPSEDPDVGAGLPTGGTRLVETLDADIHHVRSSWSEAAPARSSDGLPAWFWPLLAGAPLLPFAAAAWAHRQRWLGRDPERDRRRQAGAHARRRAAEAATAARQGRTVEAADAAAEAVGRLVAVRLGTGGAAPSPAETERLVTEAAGAELGRAVRELLADCDYLRFAGAGGDPARASELAARAKELVGRLEQVPAAAEGGKG